MTPHSAKVFCLILVCFVCGCRGEARPRSQAEIQAERETLPAIFITASGKQITKPADTGAFVDSATREIAWPAYECQNPACPGRKPDGGPHLFAWPDPRFEVTPEGTLGARELTTSESLDEAVSQAGFHSQPTCPECLKTRNLAVETRAQGEQFAEFVRLHELPSTAKRRAELDHEWETRQRP